MTCPCLLQHAQSPSVVIVAGVRTISWICGICGGLNSETEAYPPKRTGNVLHGGPLADSLMGQQYEARP